MAKNPGQGWQAVENAESYEGAGTASSAGMAPSAGLGSSPQPPLPLYPACRKTSSRSAPSNCWSTGGYIREGSSARTARRIQNSDGTRQHRRANTIQLPSRYIKYLLLYTHSRLVDTADSAVSSPLITSTAVTDSTVPVDAA